VLKSVGAWMLSAVLVLVGSNAFRQVPNEFRHTEPGSLLFGVLQLVIGTSALVGAVGLVTRARWAARFIGISGISAAALLVAQPLYEPMPSDAQSSIWLGAAVVCVAAAGMGWFARRHAKSTVPSAVSVDVAQQPSMAQLPEAQQPAGSLTPPAPSTHVPRVESSARG
jgi:hypothetical protein